MQQKLEESTTANILLCMSAQMKPDQIDIHSDMQTGANLLLNGNLYDQIRHSVRAEALLYSKMSPKSEDERKEDLLYARVGDFWSGDSDVDTPNNGMFCGGTVTPDEEHDTTMLSSGVADRVDHVR